MIRILYISEASGTINLEQINDIQKSSLKFNAMNNITGVLVYGGTLFLQLLEGPEEAVFRLYVKILDDKRHHSCQILCISSVDERMFPNWSMGFIEREPFEFQHILELRKHRHKPDQSKEFTDIMHEFIQLSKKT